MNCPPKSIAGSSRSANVQVRIAGDGPNDHVNFGSSWRGSDLPRRWAHDDEASSSDAAAVYSVSPVGFVTDRTWRGGGRFLSMAGTFALLKYDIAAVALHHRHGGPAFRDYFDKLEWARLAALMTDIIKRMSAIPKSGFSRCDV